MAADYQSIVFDFVDRPKTQVTKDRAYVLTCKLYLDGTQDVVASATVTILGPGGSPLPGAAVSGAAASVDGSGTMTYTLTAANAAVLGANYSVQWVVTDSNADVWERLQLFDVVRYPLYNVVIQADLVQHHPDLTSYLLSTESNAQAYIERAFHDVYQVLELKGFRPYLVLSPEDLRMPIEHLALAKFFAARRNETGDRWDILYQYHWGEYHNWSNATQFTYDRDESGTADGTSDTDSRVGEDGHNIGPSYRI